MQRIIDESGEDYLYPRNWFVDVHLPRTSKRRGRRQVER